MSTPRLVNRQLQIPNGLRFYLPQVKWRAPNGASFSAISQALLRVVRANPALAKQHGWPQDLPGVEDWVDRYNAALCARQGWTKYISEDAPVSIPKLSPQHLQETLRNAATAAARAKELVAGARSLMEWDESGEPPVPPDQSARRAAVCAACPQNQKGDFTTWFTVPAAELIRRRIEKANARNLSTPSDGELNLCIACHCPLRLKVHVPLDWITKRLTEDQKAGLRAGRNCWILSEGRL